MKTLLIIEDDQYLLDVYKDSLIEEKINVITSTTVNAALVLLQSAKELPNLILLDVMLPGEQNGLDLLKIIKSSINYSHIPVIMLTNLDTTEQTARKLGADDYIIKVNVTLDELIGKIKKYLPANT